ncbi:hypothetical protein Micbo1qcDRAFT_236815 [Microdochium bolleyi]|uniref:SET domain-containing protein n=1 Tax=Microdochium bolleyi TaxID=196109 RepID=A0A136IP96_9PEZI|nr:hypothetical protein Micbo1qcDRAFT_236815 [Microdochium bolleyi]
MTAPTAAERYAALVSWVSSAGGTLHPFVEIYNDADTEGSLRVKPGRSLAAGDTIVKLPLSRSLSFLNAICGHPDFHSATAATLGVIPPESYFPTAFLRETPPHVVGRFFLVQEYLRGEQSAWAPYIRTLPQPTSSDATTTTTGGLLPCAWPAADVEFLRGTNAWVAVQEINATLDSEYAAAVDLLQPADGGSSGGSIWTEFTSELYRWAYCVFASRSFRQSLTIPGGAGAAGGLKADDFSVLLPLFDMGNHHPLAKTAWKTPEDISTTSSTNDNHTSASEAAAIGGTLFCELQTGQAYSAGEQVYNNYGPSKTNAELLLGYGFVLAESDEFHNDYVHVRTRPSTNSSSHDAAQSHLASTHLVSLQPMSDPSSLAGRARMRLGADKDPEPILGCYTHVQDSLVASLYEMVCQARGIPAPDRSSSGSEQQGSVSLAAILAGEIPEELTDEIINALGTKLSMDLEKIEAAEAEQAARMGKTGGQQAEPRNGNQQLAALYRSQCRRVLENALASLSGEEEYEEMEEES